MLFDKYLENRGSLQGERRATTTKMERKETKDIAVEDKPNSTRIAGAKVDDTDILAARMASSFKVSSKDEDFGRTADGVSPTRSGTRNPLAEAKIDGPNRTASPSHIHASQSHSRPHTPAGAESKLFAEAKLDAKTSSDEVIKRKLTAEEIQEEKVESEFEEMLRKPNVAQIEVSDDPRAKEILSGFKLLSMNMRDGTTGKMIWESSNWGPDMFDKEMVENIPKEILQCRQVSREINFSSVQQLSKFRIEQRIFFQGQCIEQWFFSFGFVIPGSTNTWQQMIEAAPPDEMMPAEVLSGHIVIETSFFDNQMFICKNLVRLHYV